MTSIYDNMSMLKTAMIICLFPRYLWQYFYVIDISVNEFMLICLYQRYLCLNVFVKSIYDNVSCERYLWQYVYVKDIYDNMSMWNAFMTI